MDALLEIRGLRIETASGARLVDDVDLDLRPGEVLGLIGESGAGKSTIGLAAMGYARAGCRIVGGTIAIGGRDLRSLGPDGRRAVRGTRIAYVAQSAASAFNPALTILDQVCEGPVYHGLKTRDEAVRWAVETFGQLGLPDPESFGRRYPHEVSGGQLQRAMAAMAMACKPDILVFDEPTTALDVTTQIEVLALIKGIIRSFGTAALYITHDLAVVAQVADRIMVLRGGRVVEVGDCRQILEAPREDYTRALVAERSIHDALIERGDRPRSDAVLSVDGLTAFHGDFQVLTDVSLTLDEGETLAIVGQSGSGKSSLARVLVGLHPPRTGRLAYRGVALAASCRKRRPDQQREIQLVYQHPDASLNPRQTVGEIVGRPAAFYRGLAGAELDAEVSALLRMVGLPEAFASVRSGAVSGGQKQRVAIARALAAKPSVIVCDEPTSALDPLVAQEILALLVRLQQDLGLAYLFITHDLGIVRRIAHRTMVLCGGRIVTTGATEAVFSPPMHAYTRTLIESVPDMRTDWLDRVLQSRDAAG